MSAPDHIVDDMASRGFLTLRAASARLGVSRDTLRSAIRRGRIVAVERVAGVPFFSLADLRRLGLALVACLLVSCASSPKPVPVKGPSIPGPTLHAPASMSAPEAFAWAAGPAALDWWTTEDVLSRPGARELNPFGQSQGKRAATAIGTSAVAAWVFHHYENKPGGHWSRKAPRWLWTAGHGLAGLWNLWQARRRP